MNNNGSKLSFIKMDNWIQLVENINSHYRNDYSSKVICDWLLITVEQNNLTEKVFEKYDQYLKNDLPLNALIKACYDHNIIYRHE